MTLQVKWLLARPVIAIGSYIVISVIAILMFVKWPSTFIPEEDDGYFMIAIQLPAASSLERTQMVGKQIDAIFVRVSRSEDLFGSKRIQYHGRWSVA